MTNTNTASVSVPALTARAAAVLVMMRVEGLTERQLWERLGDMSMRLTRELLTDMRSMGLIAELDGCYLLDHDGLGWLQDNGLDAREHAKIWVMNGSQGTGLPTPARKNRASGADLPGGIAR